MATTASKWARREVMPVPGARPEPRAGRPWPADLLDQARSGDARAREELIARFTPFILRVAAQACGRYVRLGLDDEASVALIAFNEAIDRYDASRGAGFLPFSQQVIRRRLVDYFRSQSRHPETPFSSLAGEAEEDEAPGEGAVEAFQVAGALSEHQRAEQASARREEIEEFRRELRRLGLDLTDLVRSSPRHRDTRQVALRVARRIAEVPRYRELLLATGRLPVDELVNDPGLAVRVRPKTLRRLRSYLVAVVLLLTGDFPQLRGFLPLTPEEAEPGEGRSGYVQEER
ncbi:MAG: sigma-70 family RNA polymerase sigma factor [Bacillota bacterium]|nr:sigma-70 family RNA polymerase sigma factor [Bacillota bacterium]